MYLYRENFDSKIIYHQDKKKFVPDEEIEKSLKCKVKALYFPLSTSAAYN
jgi:hypothetical protein